LFSRRKPRAAGSAALRALIGPPERWGFEALGEDARRRTTAAEPLWPQARAVARADTVILSENDSSHNEVTL
jgi:hypothetical protein